MLGIGREKVQIILTVFSKFDIHLDSAFSYSTGNICEKENLNLSDFTTSQNAYNLNLWQVYEIQLYEVHS